MPYRRPLGTLGHRDRPRLPATMPVCSTRRWLRPNGMPCRTSCGAGAPAANASAWASRIFVEKSGLGPFDGVRVSVDTSGMVEVVTGAASLGQGIETVVAQICADALGVDYRRVRVVHGRTDRIAFGVGAFASRVTVMTGEATRRAAVDVRAKAIERRGRADAATCRRARRDGRQGGAQRRRRRSFHDAGRDRPGIGAGIESARRARARASRRTAGSTPIT